MAIAAPRGLFDEITDFLASSPTAEQIVNYQPSDTLDQRLHQLLDKNEQSSLTLEEREELDEFLRMNHFLNMLVLKARLKLTKQP